MSKKPTTSKDTADKVVKNIRCKTHQAYSSEEKIRIVLNGLRYEESVADLCRPLPGRVMHSIISRGMRALQRAYIKAGLKNSLKYPNGGYQATPRVGTRYLK